MGRNTQYNTQNLEIVNDEEFSSENKKFNIDKEGKIYFQF